MFSKIVAFGTMWAVAQAYGHAVSSQSIVRHDGYGAPAYGGHLGYAGYAAPLPYAAPLAYAGHYDGHDEYGTVASEITGHETYEPMSRDDERDAVPGKTLLLKVLGGTGTVMSWGDAYHQAHPKYDFAYSVSDPHTGDHKSQHESRDGDAVHGYYSLVQPDGSVRKVEYTADDHNGFNAVVHNSAPSIHPAPYHHY